MQISRFHWIFPIALDRFEFWELRIKRLNNTNKFITFLVFAFINPTLLLSEWWLSLANLEVKNCSFHMLNQSSMKSQWPADFLKSTQNSTTWSLWSNKSIWVGRDRETKTCTIISFHVQIKDFRSLISSLWRVHFVTSKFDIFSYKIQLH